jgi:hypothetical protein
LPTRRSLRGLFVRRGFNMAEKIYRNPKSVPINGNSGYPNNVAHTQTQKTRGTGAATKGNKHSSKMG